MTAEHERVSSADASKHSPQSSPEDPVVDFATSKSLVRAVIARLGEGPTTTQALSEPLLARQVHDWPATNFTDLIYSAKPSDGPFLSVVLVASDASDAMLNDALLALDAQSEADFEVIVVLTASLGIGRARVEELLSAFSSGLAARSEIVVVTSQLPELGTRTDAVRAGFAQARGRYVTVLDATSVVFAHFVETLARLSHASPAAVLRARAIVQPLRLVNWPDGGVGFEPTGGAAPASASHFSVLEQLASSKATSPSGSYALRRDYVEELGLEGDETALLMEAALLGGVREASDEVIVLLRRFGG